MNRIHITHNPFTVETTFLVAGQPPADSCTLSSHKESRLQRWVEGLFDELSELFNGDNNFHITFKGVESDFLDVQEAAEVASTSGMQVELEWVETRPTEQRLEDIRALMAEARKKSSKFEQFINESEEISQGFEEAFNKDFDVYVVATMSSGKSTLINAMLGRDLLPAANEATTATIARITDNDKMAGQFKASRFDHSGKLVGEKDNVNLECLKEWNQLEDTQLIDIEGNIVAIRERDEVRLVLTDTPGPNNSQNGNHQKTTMGFIQDSKRNPLILYVLNAAQLGTTDDSNLLRLVADTMRKGGKQSRDRFIFVINRMDEFDPDNTEGGIPGVLERTRKYLEKNGIRNPLVYPISAQITRLIRIPVDKHSAKERGWFSGISAFFEEDHRMNLSEYMPINQKVKDILEKKQLSLLMKSSGLPAVEAMIDEYIDKYNLPYRLKRAHDAMSDAFNKGLNEAELIEKLNQDEGTLVQLNEEVMGLQQRQQKGFDTAAYQARLEREGKALPPATEEQLTGLEGSKEEELRMLAATFMGQKVSESIAKGRVEAAEKQLQFHHQKLVNDYENLFKLTQDLIRQDLKQEYRRYIEELFEGTQQLKLPILEGVRKTVGDISFNLSVTEDDVRQRRIVTGSQTVSTSRWYNPFSWGSSETVKVYGQENYVDLEALWKERSILIETAFDTLVQGARRQIKNGQDRLIEQYIAFMTREFGREFTKLLDSLQEKLTDREAREHAIEEAKQQRDQIETLKRKLEDILAI